jgi:type IV pilus assembly protein PilW
MRKSRGFSLIELSISLLLGSVVVTGVVQLFVANSATYKLLEGQSRMQESARFVLEAMGRDIQQAGYIGCLSSKGEVRINVDTASLPYEFDIRSPVAGFEGSPGGGWVPALTVLNGIDTASIATGTDILTLRYASSLESRLKNELTTSQVLPKINIEPGWFEFKTGDIAMIHDCEKSTIFRVNALTPNLTAASTIAQELTINHWQGGGAATNTTRKLADINTFSTDAAISAIYTSTYFIAPGTGINNVGVSDPIELVEGVENIQVLYGVDALNDDGVPDQYMAADAVTDWSSLVTLRVSITANSVDDVGATGDGLLHHTFSQTYFLRNHEQ